MMQLEELDFTVSDIVTHLCEMADKCLSDKDYKCELSDHIVYYLTP